MWTSQLVVTMERVASDLFLLWLCDFRIRLGSCQKQADAISRSEKIASHPGVRKAMEEAKQSSSRRQTGASAAKRKSAEKKQERETKRSRDLEAESTSQRDQALDELEIAKTKHKSSQSGGD